MTIDHFAVNATRLDLADGKVICPVCTRPFNQDAKRPPTVEWIHRGGQHLADGAIVICAYCHTITHLVFNPDDIPRGQPITMRQQTKPSSLLMVFTGLLRRFGHTRFVNHRFRVRAPGSAQEHSLAKTKIIAPALAPRAEVKPPLPLTDIARIYARAFYGAARIHAESCALSQPCPDVYGLRLRAFRLDDWASRR